MQGARSRCHYASYSTQRGGSHCVRRRPSLIMCGMTLPLGTPSLGVCRVRVAIVFFDAFHGLLPFKAADPSNTYVQNGLIFQTEI